MRFEDEGTQEGTALLDPALDLQLAECFVELTVETGEVGVFFCGLVGQLAGVEGVALAG